MGADSRAEKTEFSALPLTSLVDDTIEEGALPVVSRRKRCAHSLEISCFTETTGQESTVAVLALLESMGVSHRFDDDMVRGDTPLTEAPSIPVLNVDGDVSFGDRGNSPNGIFLVSGKLQCFCSVKFDEILSRD